MLDKTKAEKQFLEAFNKHSNEIFRYCYWRVFDREKANDCMQESFCRTWKYISEGNTIENIRAFLYRTAGNIIIDESRKKKAISLNDIMEKGFSPGVDERELAANRLMYKEAVSVIRSLDAKYKDVIIMKYVEGLSTKEIAKITGETEDNIYVRMHRGLEKAKKILKRYEN